MSTKVAIFDLAVFFEIAGCFAFWLWVRRGAPSLVLVLGMASLVAFDQRRTNLATTWSAEVSIELHRQQDRHERHRGIATFEEKRGCGVIDRELLPPSEEKPRCAG